MLFSFWDSPGPHLYDIHHPRPPLAFVISFATLTGRARLWTGGLRIVTDYASQLSGPPFRGPGHHRSDEVKKARDDDNVYTVTA